MCYTKIEKSDKYVLHEELIDYYLLEKCVIFYNHRGTETDSVFLRRFEGLRNMPELSSARWIVLKFPPDTIRFFIFILQPPHYEIMIDAIEKMMQSNWNKHFSVLDFE